MKIAIAVPAGLAWCLLAAGPAAAQTCGNALREVPEQCDDGNTRNLDGCDAGCRFEHAQRINRLEMQFTAAPACTPNALGGSVGGLAQGTIQSSFATAVADGSLSIVLQMLGLDDPAAVNDPALEVGVLGSHPIVPGSAPYNGTTSTDWWYAADPASLGPDRLPTDRLTGSLAGSVVTTQPGAAHVPIVLAGVAGEMAFSSLVVGMTTGAATTPAASTGSSPGHEAIEHLDPALQTFASTGQPSDPNWGTMCGNVSAASLAQIPVPAALQTGGSTACAEGYSATHSFLDVLAGGCRFAIFTLITATQPDQSDPAAPVLGAGPPYRLTADPQRHVNGCRDNLNATVDLAACLNAAAYSAFFKFTTHRVLAADDAVFADGFESGDLSAWSASSTGGGDLSVAAPAIVGTQGLRALVDDTTGLFVQDDEPENESRYRARFYFDPSAFDPGEANGKFRTRVFIAFEENPTRRLIAVVLRRQGGSYSLMARVRQDDNSQVNTSFFPIAATPHRVDLEWIRSSSPAANDGQLRLWLDTSLVATLTAQHNSSSSVDFVRLGALSVKPGASGVLRWDEFGSTRRSPLVP